MKTNKKRDRKTMRLRNRDRVNRLRKQAVRLEPLFILVLIKLDLNNLNAAKVAERLSIYKTMLTGNPDFPTTSPSVAELDTALGQLTALMVSASNGDRLQIELRDQKQKECEDMIRQLGYDIQHQSHGDSEKIHSAGFETRKGKSPSELPAQAQGLKAKLGVFPGTIKLRWRAVKLRSGYVVQMTTTPADSNSWSTIHKGGKVTFEVTGLQPATVYYFRVFAFNSLGDGPVSDICNQSCL